ncbi:hypothetical protein D3C80_818770 [compost metagenome]
MSPAEPNRSPAKPAAFLILRAVAIFCRATGIAPNIPAMDIKMPIRPLFFSGCFPLRSSSLAFCLASRSSRVFLRRALKNAEEPSLTPSPSESPRTVRGLRSRIPSRISSSNRIWYSPMTSIISELPPNPGIFRPFSLPLAIPSKPEAPFFNAPMPLLIIDLALPSTLRPRLNAPPTRDLAPLQIAPLSVWSFLPAMSTNP